MQLRTLGNITASDEKTHTPLATTYLRTFCIYGARANIMKLIKRAIAPFAHYFTRVERPERRTLERRANDGLMEGNSCSLTAAAQIRVGGENRSDLKRVVVPMLGQYSAISNGPNRLLVDGVPESIKSTKTSSKEPDCDLVPYKANLRMSVDRILHWQLSLKYARQQGSCSIELNHLKLAK